MAKKLFGSYVGLSALGVASVLLVLGAANGCATGAADSFGGAGGAGTTSASVTSTKAVGSTGATNTTGANNTVASTSGSSMGVCGNGICSQDESCQTCPADCSCSGVCGDGTCDAGETCASCPNDCDMGCGTGSSMSTSSGGSCDPCTVGPPLDPTTCMSDPFITFVCGFDDTCCTVQWSQGCIDTYSLFGSCP